MDRTTKAAAAGNRVGLFPNLGVNVIEPAIAHYKSTEEASRLDEAVILIASGKCRNLKLC
jgi:hypothetical protein